MEQRTSKLSNRTLTPLIVVIVLVCTGGAGFAGGKKESINQDLGDFKSVRLETPDVRIEVSESRDEARIEALIDSRREFSVSVHDGSVVIKVTRIRGITAPKEIVRLFVGAGKSVEIQSGSGAIEIAGVEYSDLSIHSGSGKVNVSHSLGPVSVSNGSGSTMISNSDGKKNLHSGSGSIIIRDSDGDIVASNGSRAINLNGVVGALVITNGSGSIFGDSIMLTGDSSFGNGSGRIDLSFLNLENELTFDLETETGSIRVGDTQSNDRMILGSGNIKITGRGGSGRQKYELDRLPKESLWR